MKPIRAPSPKTLASEISFPFSIHTGDVDGALCLDKADHVRHCVFWRDRDQHVHVVKLQMTPLIRLSFCAAKLVKHLPKMLAQLPE